MSIRDSHRSLRDRWPLQFDLEGVPRDAKLREQMLEDLRSNSPDLETRMNVPVVKNTFATDLSDVLKSLTPAQKMELTKALLAEPQGGQEFDLSKPPVAPYRYQEYPKCMYSADGRQSVVARDEEHEKELLKKKFSPRPHVKKQEEEKELA